MTAPALIVAEPPPGFSVRPPLVADCSLLCAVVFDEPERMLALQRLAGRTLHAPALLAHEVVSVALKKRKRGWPVDALASALADFQQFPVELHATDVPAQFALSEQYGLSAYDAAYLWLAAELKAPLATFDRKLGEAAQRHLSALE